MNIYKSDCQRPEYHHALIVMVMGVIQVIYVNPSEISLQCLTIRSQRAGLHNIAILIIQDCMFSSLLPSGFEIFYSAHWFETLIGTLESKVRVIAYN